MGYIGRRGRVLMLTTLVLALAAWLLASQRSKRLRTVALAMAQIAAPSEPVRPPGEFPLVLEDWSCGRAVAISAENPAVVTCSSPHGLPETSNYGRPWRIFLSGATGDWTPLNGNHEIQILDENRFSVQVDASGFGSFEGQTVVIVRGNHEGAELWRANFNGNDGSKAMPRPEGGFARVHVPEGYISTVNTMNCMPTSITSFTVQGGEATVTLARPLFYEKPSYVIAPGREIHFRHFAEPSLNSMRYTARGEDRPHYITWVNEARTEFRAKVDVPDGSYGSASESQPAQTFVCPQTNFTMLFLARSVGGYPMPYAKASEYAKTGPVPESANRLYLWVKWGKRIARLASNSWLGTIGTYAKSPEDPEPRTERFHFYHHYSPNFYEGRWMRFILNNQPQHVRSAAGYAIPPLDPMRRGWPFYSSPLWDERVAEYLPNLTYFYIDTNFRAVDFTNQTVDFGPVVFDRAEGEPDGYVSSITAVWDGERFGNRGPGYEVGFYAPKYAREEFEVRYSTKASLKDIGFSQGEEVGKVQGTGTPANNLMWYSPKMEEQAQVWVGIRPRMRVAGVTGAGISPMLVSLWAESGLAEGDHVNISGVRDNSAINKTTTVRPVERRFWWLGKGLERVEVTNNRAVFTFSEPHGLQPGQVFELANSPNTNLGRVPSQRYYTVQETPSLTTLAVRTQSVPDGDYSQSASKAESLYVWALPALAIEGAATGIYGGSGCTTQRLCDGGGVVVSTEERRNFTEVPIFQYDPDLSIRDQLHKQKRVAAMQAIKTGSK